MVCTRQYYIRTEMLKVLKRPSLPVFFLASVASSELMWIIRSDAKLEDIAQRTEAAKIRLQDSVTNKPSTNKTASSDLTSLTNLANPDSKILHEITEKLDAEDSNWATAPGQKVSDQPKSGWI